MLTSCTVSMKKEDHSRSAQVECCYICGHKGYSELLVCCADCAQLSVHKYCLGIVPGSTEDMEDVYWVCECCSQSLNTLPSDHMSDNTSTENCYPKSKCVSDEAEVICVEEQPKPLCTLYPEGYPNCSEQSPAVEEFKSHASYGVEHPTEISEGVVLLVSPSGEIIFHDEMSFLDDYSNSATLPRSILTSEHPTEISRGVVFLVSPSGETIIHNEMSFP